MGATTFETYSLGKTPQEAWNRATEEACYYHGHGGYTGTVAEKPGFVLFKIPPGSRLTPEKFVSLMYEMENFISLEYLRDDLKWARNKTDKRQREAQIRKEERVQAAFWRKHAKIEAFLRRAYDVYREKWEAAVAIEITGSRAVQIKKSRQRSGTRDRVYLFCGWASC